MQIPLSPPKQHIFSFDFNDYRGNASRHGTCHGVNRPRATVLDSYAHSEQHELPTRDVTVALATQLT